MTERTDRPARKDSDDKPHTAGAFDIREIIAILIGTYGVILVVVGIVNSSQADLRKPDGININLWRVLAMVIAAAAFAAGAMLRPVVIPPRDEDDGTRNAPG